MKLLSSRIDQFDAVTADFFARQLKELRRRNAVPCEIPVDVLRPDIAGFPRVDDGDPPSCTPEEEGGTQAGRTTADDHDVVRIFRIHAVQRFPTNGIDIRLGGDVILDILGEVVDLLRPQVHACFVEPLLEYMGDVVFHMAEPDLGSYVFSYLLDDLLLIVRVNAWRFLIGFSGHASSLPGFSSRKKVD
jgi:hypothetical protein